MVLGARLPITRFVTEERQGASITLGGSSSINETSPIGPGETAIAST